MPTASFLSRVHAGGVSFATARQLAVEYRVSATAALAQMARIGPGQHAAVLWRMKNKPRDDLKAHAPNQLGFFGLPARPPSKKLRVEWSLNKAGAPYIPAHKSVPESSSIYKAWRDGVFTAGQDVLDLGKANGLFGCENQPFEADGDRQVLSLLHLPGDTECALICNA